VLIYIPGSSDSIKCVVSEMFLIINVAVTFLLYNKERFIFSFII